MAPGDLFTEVRLAALTRPPEFRCLRTPLPRCCGRAQQPQSGALRARRPAGDGAAGSSQAHAEQGSEPGDAVTLDSLFDLSYIRKPVSTVQWALLVVYTPFGIVLAVVRILLTVVLCLFAIGTKKFLPAITLADRTYAAALLAAPA